MGKGWEAVLMAIFPMLDPRARAGRSVPLLDGALALISLAAKLNPSPEANGRGPLLRTV